MKTDKGKDESWLQKSERLFEKTPGQKYLEGMKEKKNVTVKPKSYPKKSQDQLKMDDLMKKVQPRRTKGVGREEVASMSDKDWAKAKRKAGIIG